MIRRICPLCAGNNIESQDSQLVISPQLYSSNFTTDFYGFQVRVRLKYYFLYFLCSFFDRDPHPERQKWPTDQRNKEKTSMFLKGLSHEIDFKNFDKNLQNLT